MVTTCRQMFDLFLRRSCGWGCTWFALSKTEHESQRKPRRTARKVDKRGSTLRVRNKSNSPSSLITLQPYIKTTETERKDTRHEIEQTRNQTFSSAFLIFASPIPSPA